MDSHLIMYRVFNRLESYLRFVCLCDGGGERETMREEEVQIMTKITNIHTIIIINGFSRQTREGQFL